jgi:putative FmdB family regulatory protein
MPIYEFACRQCAATFEELVNTGETGEHLSCPQCGSTKLQKRMSAFSGRVGQGKTNAAESRVGGCPTGSCCFGDACGM